MPIPSFTVTCRQNDVIAHDIHEIRFTKPDGFTYKAGQFLMFDVPLLDNPEDIQPRAYSIASAPEEDDLLFCIKLVENGRASAWISNQLKEGDEVRMQGPLGFFGLKESTKDCLMICTATGNAPFRSMAIDALSKGDARRMDLIFGVRHEEDLFWVEEFERIEKEHENFHLHVVLSRPGDGWSGHKGHVQDIVPAICEDFGTKQIYVCGNPAMTDEVKKLCLEEWGIAKEDLHVEGFI